MSLNATEKEIIGGLWWISASCFLPCRKMAMNRSISVRLVPKSNQLLFLILWMHMPPAVNSFGWIAMTSGCTRKNCFWSCDLDKGRRSSLSMWKIFPGPRNIRAKNEKKALIIREIFKGDHNAAAAAAVGRTRVKTNKRPFQGTLNYQQ